MFKLAENLTSKMLSFK